jgi:hypothetical protein
MLNTSSQLMSVSCWRRIKHAQPTLPDIGKFDTLHEDAPNFNKG